MGSHSAGLKRPDLVPEGTTERDDRARPGAREPGTRLRGPLRPAELAPSRLRVGRRDWLGAFPFADLAVMYLGAALAWAATGGGNPMQAPFGTVLPFLAAPAMAAWAMRAFDVYAFPRDDRLAVHLARVAAALAPALACWILYALVLGDAASQRASVLATGLAAAGMAVLHAIWWTLVTSWRRAGRLTPNVVVVGATANAAALIAAAMETHDVAVLGIFDDRMDRIPPDIHGVPVLGDTQAILGHKIMPSVDKVIITVPPTAEARVRELVDRLRVLPNDIHLLLEPDHGSGADPERVARASLARLSGMPVDPRRIALKRMQDLVIGTIGLVLVAPVMAAVALAIKLDSPGPVFFRQRRHGFNNEEIVVWKFRSMRQDATDARAVRQVSADDDRVTRIGRFIRRTSLDELPQLFNVLSGEMSLVGPRPHAIGMQTAGQESARLVAEYAHRHRVKPGMTGWAAINGSRGPVATPEEVRRRVALDVDYIERQSFWFDLYIILMTVPRLLGDGSAVR